MAEVIALLYQEICYRGVCYKSVPLYMIHTYYIYIRIIHICMHTYTSYCNENLHIYALYLSDMLAPSIIDI